MLIRVTISTRRQKLFCGDVLSGLGIVKSVQFCSCIKIDEVASSHLRLITSFKAQCGRVPQARID